MNSQHKFHNRHNLTPEQVGDGYRLLLESEIMNRPISKDIHCWDDHQNKWDTMGWGGYGSGQTYRVPLATWPLPEEYACPPVKGPEVEELQSRFDPEIPWTEWHGGECPLKDEEVEEWEYEVENGYKPISIKASKPSAYSDSWKRRTDGWGIIAYRVLKWKNKPAQEPPPTDNDAWECLLRTNADLGREVSELRRKVSSLTLQLEDANRLKQSALEGVKMWSDRSNQNADDIEKREKVIESLTDQLQGVITACHLRGYDVGDSLGEWIEKQFDVTKRMEDYWKSRFTTAVKVLSFLHNEREELGLTVGQDIIEDGVPALRNQRDQLKSKLQATETRLAQLEWVPFCLPASIDTDRVEFKKWWTTSGFEQITNAETAFQAWKAAREGVK